MSLEPQEMFFEPAQRCCNKLAAHNIDRRHNMASNLVVVAAHKDWNNSANLLADIAAHRLELAERKLAADRLELEEHTSEPAVDKADDNSSPEELEMEPLDLAPQPA